MKLSKLSLALVIITAFSACSGGGKKVLIMASGKLTVDDNDQKHITVTSGTTHNEKEIELTGSGKETLTVQGPQGNKTYDLAEAGHYVLNLKPDTLVGGIVRYGAGNKTSNLTGEDVDRMIDSTQLLITGENVSDESKTYFIPPNSVKKLSTSTDSRIVGPYNGIPGSIDVNGSGKSPEVYKLYTTKQKRESLEDLIKERKK
jgi:hypothetical protein